MGRNTDKLYVTQSEHSGLDGRHGSSTGITQKKFGTVARRLPFIYCALTLQLWEHPVCVVDADKQATIFDLLAIVPWLQKKGTHPITAKALDAKDLIKLNFAKNDAGEKCDPVTMKVFNDHTHIVAIKHTGHVFAYETVERLNYKAKYWKDLMSDEPFTREDVITIQDPHNVAVTNTVAESVRRDVPDPTPAATSEKERKVEAARQAIAKLRNKDGAPVPARKPTVLPYNVAHYSTGYTAASFTNTGMRVSTKDDRAILSDEQYLLQRKKIKTKGLCILRTSHGNLDLELWPEHAPKAVYNFIKLAQRGYYTDIPFHRNIPNFMVQGGDASGTGKGGQSIFGKDFEDEISATRTHDKRGIVSMANKGPNTNASQFFITYAPAQHLDKKHTIFGHVIGDLTTLGAMERVTAKEEQVRMIDVQVILDPFEEYLAKQQQQDNVRETRTKEQALLEDDTQTWTNRPMKHGTERIGKYIDTNGTSTAAAPRISATQEETAMAHEPPKKRIKTGQMHDFSGW